MADEAAVSTGEPASAEVWEGKAVVPDQPPEDSSAGTPDVAAIAEAWRGKVSVPDQPPEDSSAGTPDVAVTTSEGAPGIPGSEGSGVVSVPEEDGRVPPPIWPAGPQGGPFVADVCVVEGAKGAVRTLARQLAGVDRPDEPVVPASAEISYQAVFTCGAQWVMSCDLTPGKLYLVTYDGALMAYFVDAYAHVPDPDGRLTVPREHGYA